MPAKERSRLVPIVLIVVVLVVAGVGAGLLYYFTHSSSSSGRPTVQLGDNATVNYIGFFGSGPQTGRVFDTSLYSVATNNATYPKSLEFAMRSNVSSYTPLAVHVGPTTPQSGYSLNGLSFIQVVTGFWQGLLGLPGNQTSSVTVPPALGYGSPDPACFRNLSLTFSVPVMVTLTSSEFSTDFPGVTAAQGAQFPNPTYGWPVYVVSANSTRIVVVNQPSPGWTSYPNGWPVEVTAVNATAITVTNELTSANAGLVAGHSSQTVCSSNQYVVSAVSAGAGTFTQDYNKEVVGQTLIFVVTVVGVFP
jgi:FKBP-type peptidyl-prolyl cis-trans isomerase 2